VSIFRPQKYDRGAYTGFIAIKGEVKMKNGAPVMEEVKTKDEFEQEIVTKVEARHKKTYINLAKNYEEGQEPQNYEDREGCFCWASTRKGEADYIGRVETGETTDEGKKIYETVAEINYNEETNRFEGHFKGVEIVSDVLSSTDRIVQFNLKSEVETEDSEEDMPF
jgi:hypothetical protein